MSEFAPRMTISGTFASASNSFHRSGIGCSRSTPAMAVDEFRIVGRHQATVFLLKDAARAGQPIVRSKPWKLR